MVETLVQEKAMLVEVVAAEGVMQELMVDIMDLEVTVAIMVVVLVIAVEEATVAVETKVVATVAVETKVVDMVAQ